MRTAYRVLAYLIAAEVLIQAAAMAYAVSGLGKWIQDGGVLDKATMDSGQSLFPEEVGFMIHGINGQMLIPLLALVLLIISFFAKVPRGAMWAAGVFGLVVVQVLLGIFGRGLPFVALLHGANAIALFTVAFLAARRARGVVPVRARETSAEATGVHS